MDQRRRWAWAVLCGCVLLATLRPAVLPVATPALAKAPFNGRENPYRVWTSDNGKFTLTAALLGLSDGTALLRTEKGEHKPVPVAILSAADRQYVSQFKDDLVGKVVAVSDGDSITLLTDDLNQVKIRLEGIDAPEFTQDFGTQAKKALSAKVFQKRIRIHRRGEDRYGRTLGYLFVGDEWINKSMVELGMAWHYKQYSSDPELAQAEIDARNKKVGVWSHPDPVPPWDYRHRSGSGNASAKPANGDAPPSIGTPAPPMSNEADKVVYVTSRGLKYHRANCKYLRGSLRKLSLDEAKQLYQPCGVCKPQ